MPPAQGAPEAHSRRYRTSWQIKDKSTHEVRALCAILCRRSPLNFPCRSSRSGGYPENPAELDPVEATKKRINKP
jgi:hypothetical protein